MTLNSFYEVTDISAITPESSDDLLVRVKPAGDFTGHTFHSMRTMRNRGEGPISFLRAGRIVYRLGDLRQYNEDKRQQTLAGSGVPALVGSGALQSRRRTQ